MQITDAPIHASLAVSDLARARAWYADKLGWEPTIEPPGTCVYELFGSAFTLFETPMAGTAQNTVMTWNVQDVSAEVGRLRERGVVFEDYDFGDGDITVDGILPGTGDLPANAWFTDSEGNVLAIAEDRN